jgi:hypothetical protein
LRSHAGEIGYCHPWSKELAVEVLERHPEDVHVLHMPHVLPADEEAVPTNGERLRYLLLVIVPWLGLYALTSALHLRGTPFGLAFERRLPIVAWTTLLYQSIYLTILLSPWLAKTRRDLRRLTISCWMAMIVVFPFYWLVPSVAPRRPVLGSDWISRELRLERTTFPPIAAFPSFHVLWAVFLSRMIRPQWVGWAYAAIIAVSCITTGQHFIPDVLVAFAISPLLDEPKRIWDKLRWVERLLINPQ